MWPCIYASVPDVFHHPFQGECVRAWAVKARARVCVLMCRHVCECGRVFSLACRCISSSVSKCVCCVLCGVCVRGRVLCMWVKGVCVCEYASVPTSFQGTGMFGFDYMCESLVLARDARWAHFFRVNFLHGVVFAQLRHLTGPLTRSTRGIHFDSFSFLVVFFCLAKSSGCFFLPEHALHI